MEVGVFLNFTVIKFRCEINDVFSLSLSLSLSLGGFSRMCCCTGDDNKCSNIPEQCLTIGLP